MLKNVSKVIYVIFIIFSCNNTSNKNIEYEDNYFINKLEKGTDADLYKLINDSILNWKSNNLAYYSAKNNVNYFFQ